MSRSYFPDDVGTAQSTCALRFLGYEYLESLHKEKHQEQIQFIDIINPIVNSLQLHDNQNMNLCAFFGLQRYLHKWGGERLTKFSAEHIAYDFLFLSLYRDSTPQEFTDKRYENDWNTKFKAEAEKVAAFVRMSFRRAGRGKIVL